MLVTTRGYLRNCSHTVEMANSAMIYWRFHRNVTSAMKPHGENRYLIFVLSLAVLNAQNSTVALFPCKKNEIFF